jgi:hypothetical protein
VKFSDKRGREYDCVVTIATAIKFKKLGVNLMGSFDGKLWEQLADDPELLVNVLAESVRGSLDEMNVTEEEFARSLGGDSLESASLALRQAIADFSPPLQRAAMKKLIEKSDQAQQMAAERMLKAIDDLTPESLLNSLNSAGNKLESSDSHQETLTQSDSVK